VRRGQLYPLCVGAERVMQAQQIALMARKLGTNSIAHGCTAAGNDQVRFEVAMRTLAPELEVIAPVRDRAFKRQEELDYLNARKLPLPPYGAAYSVNRGLWGVTIGGKETLTSEGSIPDAAWVLSKDAFTHPKPPATHTNCLVIGGREVIIVDPGSPYDDEQQALDDALDALFAKDGKRVRAILVTHHHADHWGGVARLKAKEGKQE